MEDVVVYWRFWRTANGRRLIKEQLDALDDRTHADLDAAMQDVVVRGIRAASRPVEGDIREIDADGPDHTTYRLLFAKDGRFGQILLAVVLFEKRTQKTPKAQKDLAKKRLFEWREARALAEKERELAEAAQRAKSSDRPNLTGKRR